MKPKLLLWFSLASLILPFVAYLLCSVFSTGRFFLHAPSYGRNVVLLREYAFLASAIVGGMILLADLRFRWWRLVWLPLASLILTCFLFVWSAIFVGFYD